MVKYICSVDRGGIVISCDKDTENVSALDNFYVDYMYYVPEDGEWVYTKKDGSKNRRSVTKGTIVLKMYPIDKDGDREYIFVENDEVKNHYNRLLEKRQENAVKKAASCDTDCDTGCDTDCGCETVRCGY